MNREHLAALAGHLKAAHYVTLELLSEAPEPETVAALNKLAGQIVAAGTTAADLLLSLKGESWA